MNHILNENYKILTFKNRIGVSENRHIKLYGIYTKNAILNDRMTWENRGLYNGEFNYGWDIDHIIPLSSAETEEDIIKLNHYTNLQPLCSKINRDIKKDIYATS